MVALGITYFANNSCYYLLELEGYEIDNLKIQTSFDMWGRVYISIYDVERGSPRTIKVSIYMRGMVDFSTYMEYR